MQVVICPCTPSLVLPIPISGGGMVQASPAGAQQSRREQAPGLSCLGECLPEHAAA